MGIAVPRNATLPQFQFGVAVEGRAKGLKSAAVEVPRLPFYIAALDSIFFK